MSSAADADRTWTPAVAASKHATPKHLLNLRVRLAAREPASTFETANMTEGSTALAGPRPRLLKGMALMLLSTACFTGLSICVRIVSEELHPLQVGFFRCLFGLLVLLPMLMRTGLSPLKTQHLGLHAARTACAVGSMFFFFTALSMVPLAKVTAIHFSAPLFATVLAIVFLRERPRIHSILALAFGFLGAWIILRPGSVGMDTGTLVVLCASVIWAFGLMITKIVVRTESSMSVGLYLGLISTPMALIPALFVWQWPSWHALGILIVVGFFGNGHHMAMSQAFKHGDSTAIMPLDFTRLLWTALFGFILFAEIPTVATVIGGTMIFVSGAYLALRERHTDRNQRKDEKRNAADA
jgi:drug/metabolite transporter (DMT)-like permease